MARGWMVVPLGCLLVGCAGEEVDANTAEDELPEPAPVATPTGACPDLSTPGEKTIESNGVERKFAIHFPEARPAGMSVLFAWHGLTATSIDGSPSAYDPIPNLVIGLGLEDLAEQENAVILVPEAEPISLMGMNVLLWGILDNEANDLALYDDLRACVDEEFDVNLRHVTSWGFSGGGLWTSLLLMERADTLATAVSISGGTDLVIPVLGDRLSYRSPANPIPTMLASGGSADIWPDPTFPIIVFDETTDNLAAGLVDDESYVVRCRHDGGHTLPSWLWDRSVKWLFKHTFGAPSPYQTGEANLHRDCEVVGG
jgi:hypothetical protein